MRIHTIQYMTTHFLALSQTADYSVTVLHYFVLKDLLYFSMCFLHSFCELVLRQLLFMLDFFY